MTRNREAGPHEAHGGIEPISPELMATPLDFFFAEHFRHLPEAAPGEWG